MNVHPEPRPAPAGRNRWARSLLALALAAGAAVPTAGTVAHAATAPTGEPSTFSLNVPAGAGGAELADGHQGFSVESADFAHGFLTRDRMAGRLKTLGSDGVLRLGGYSMDLVWPAFGKWSRTSAPKEAIGGTVDQSDLDALRKLVDATGWKVTLGLPLKAVIDPAKLKNPAQDPAPG